MRGPRRRTSGQDVPCRCGMQHCGGTDWRTAHVHHGQQRTDALADPELINRRPKPSTVELCKTLLPRPHPDEQFVASSQICRPYAEKLGRMEESLGKPRAHPSHPLHVNAYGLISDCDRNHVP